MRQPVQRRRDATKPKEKKASKKPAGRNNRPQAQSAPPGRGERANDVNSLVSLAAADIPIALQQLLLNIFKAAFVLWPEAASSHNARNIKPTANQEVGEQDSSPQPTSQLIQTLKSHLYRRDFASAFADANSDLLRVYALRWSAGRALGYAGIFNTVLNQLCWGRYDDANNSTSSLERLTRLHQHILCIGGGAGAEIVALAGVLRSTVDNPTTDTDGECSSSTSPSIQAENQQVETDLADEVLCLSLNNDLPNSEAATKVPKTAIPASARDVGPTLSVTAVDIADWNPIVQGLSDAIFASSVPSTKSCLVPLLPRSPEREDRLTVSFRKEDVLSLSEEGLRALLLPANGKPQGNAAPTPPFGPGTSRDTDEVPTLVTLMFTLNELFSTSMPKTVSMLLKLTDLARPGTILLVVDSPGSYSTVSIGSKSSKAASDTKAGDEETKPSEKKYPMRFLLEHTLLSVAAGQWKCILSDESRWFRRDRTALKYQIGEGIGLEDMRYQIHIYQRTTGD